MKNWNSKTGRERLRQLIRERAYSEGKTITLASGKQSNFYLDCKQITLDGEGLWLLSNLIVEEVRSRGITALGGLTLGADPIAAGAALAAHEVDYSLKAFIVRKAAKEHGKQKRIEGSLTANDRICVVEDVVTTGGSAKQAIEVLEEAGHKIELIITIVDREDSDADWLRKDPRFLPLFRLSEIRNKG